jgi:WD40 repeat protein
LAQLAADGLARACKQRLACGQAHTFWVLALAIAPVGVGGGGGGNLLASASGDNTVVLWDTTTLEVGLRCPLRIRFVRKSL